jgi:hypothetical protein
VGSGGLVRGVRSYPQVCIDPCPGGGRAASVGRVTSETPTTRLHADPVLTAHIAGEVLDAAGRLGDTARPLLAALEVDEVAFGSLASARALAVAHGAGVADLGSTVGSLTSALECDADRLFQVAFGLEAAEERAAERTGRLGGAR